MAKVRRGNRTLKVSEAAINNYLKQGYDQIDEKGNVIRKATGGRMVTLAEHNKALDEVEKLKEENIKFKDEIKKLKKEGK